MKNRRVFQRNDCNIPVIVHQAGRFFYGEIIDFSVSGVRLRLSGSLATGRIELSPKRKAAGGAVIPLPYEVRWQRESEVSTVGLQFTGGTDAFFRGWLSEYLKIDDRDFVSLLDNRKLVRIPCKLSGNLRTEDEESAPCTILDVSLGGLNVVSKLELYPGMSCLVSFDRHPQLGILDLFLLRVQSLTGHSLCGGRFLELSAEQQGDLEALLLELVKQSPG